MILKFSLSGEEYQALLSVLQSDSNHFTEGPPSKPLRTPFAQIKSAKTEGPSPWKGLPRHQVTLEIEETYSPLGGEGGPVPLSALTRIFDEIGWYPTLAVR